MQESFIVGSAVALVAAIIGWFLNRNSAKKAVGMAFEKATDLLIRQEFIKAGNELKNAFSNTEELASNGYFVYKFVERLCNETPEQERAFIKFAAHLSDSRRGEFRKAWQEYKCEDKKSFIRKYEILERGNNQDKIENDNSRKLILGQINEILHFTNPKFLKT